MVVSKLLPQLSEALFREGRDRLIKGPQSGPPRTYRVVAAFPPPGPQFQQPMHELGAAHGRHALRHTEHERDGPEAQARALWGTGAQASA